MKYDKEKILSATSWLTDIKIFEETDSTQQEARADGQKNCLYLAETQRATYGRFGRNYFAANGGIYMSVALPLSQMDNVQVTLLAASAVVRAIEELTGLSPRIKWVNDIYLADKKCVGILAEKDNAHDQMILGMGINFTIQQFPSALAAHAISLFPEGKPTISPETLIGRIWQNFYQLKKQDYFSIYTSHSFILGQEVAFTQNGQDFAGLASDLTLSGELVITFSDGSQKILHSGEISLKKWTSK